jgi:hypothetical protein
MIFESSRVVLVFATALHAPDQGLSNGTSSVQIGPGSVFIMVPPFLITRGEFFVWAWGKGGEKGRNVTK